MRKIRWRLLYNSVKKLEKFNILEFSTQVVSEVANIVAIVARMGVKVDWIDIILGEIGAKREHHNLLQEARNLKKKIEQLEREREEAVRCLREIDVEIVYTHYGSHTIIITKSML